MLTCSGVSLGTRETVRVVIARVLINILGRGGGDRSAALLQLAQEVVRHIQLQ